MNETTTTDGRTDRRTYLKLAGTGALAAGVAGCLGLGGTPSSQNGDSAAEGDSGGGASGNNEKGDGGADDGDTGSSSRQSSDNSEPAPYGQRLSLNERAVTFYRFKQPETYTFEVYDTFNDKGRLVVDVVEVTDNRVVTVKFHYKIDDLTYEDTITGEVTANNWDTKLLVSDASSMLPAATNLITYYTSTHRQITVGDEWTPKGLTGTYEAKITGTDTIAGAKCYTFTVVFGRGEDKYVDKGCMAPNLQMLPQIVNKKGGDLQQKMTLVEYKKK